MTVSIATNYLEVDSLDETRAWLRLSVACIFSLALHFFLFTEVAIRPSGGSSAAPSVITARLEAVDPAPQTSAVNTQIEPEESVSSSKAVAVDPLLDPVPKVEPAKPAADPVSPATASMTAPGVEVPFIGDPNYYPTRELDQYPLPLAEPRFDFPERAAAAGISEGSVLVLLFIDEFGVVNRAEVIESNPPGIFEETARANWMGVRFSHGIRQGRAVKSRIQFRTRYTAEPATGQGQQ